MKNIFLVDADDTILDFHGVSSRALRIAFDKSNIPWEERFSNEYKRFNSSLWEKLEKKELSRAELMQNRFVYFFKYLEMDVDGNAFNKFYLDYLANTPVYIDGAQDFLCRLRQLGRVYIVTNGTEWIQRTRFDISGLWSYAEETFISEQVGYDKPDFRYTTYVAEHIPNFKKERAIWIGDSLSADIRAANEFGIDSIWYNPHGHTKTNVATPTYTAKSFEEILKFLEKIGR